MNRRINPQKMLSQNVTILLATFLFTAFTSLVGSQACGAPGTCPTPGLAPSRYYCLPGGYTLCTSLSSGNYCLGGKVGEISCSAGSYCPSASAGPTSCTAGSYCSSAGLSSLTGTCSAGSYCPTGSINPTLCGASFYCPNDGESSETNCTAGSYYCSTTGLLLPTAICPAGSYCPTGSVNPTSCTAGSFCSSTGLSSWY
jgi:hypothetical protein